MSANAPTSVKGAPKPPKEVDIPDGPAPEKVVVEDLKEGNGAEIQFGQEFIANFLAYDYKTGERLEHGWGDGAVHWVWGSSRQVDGLEIGIEGMRVGDLRQITVPSELAYGSGPRVYLLELLEVG